MLRDGWRNLEWVGVFASEKGTRPHLDAVHALLVGERDASRELTDAVFQDVVDNVHLAKLVLKGREHLHELP